MFKTLIKINVLGGIKDVLQENMIMVFIIFFKMYDSYDMVYGYLGEKAMKYFYV